MDKTVVVLVERLKEHPKYRRRYKVSKKYKAHDEKGEYKIGDVVVIEECRPISADKRWKVVKEVVAAEVKDKESKNKKGKKEGDQDQDKEE